MSLDQSPKRLTESLEHFWEFTTFHRYFCFTLCRPFANGGEHICTKIRGCRLCTPKNLCLAQHGKMHFRYCTWSHLPHIHIVSICSHSDCSLSLTNLTKLLPLGLIPLSSLTQRVIIQDCMISHLPALLTETLRLSLPH